MECEATVSAERYYQTMQKLKSAVHHKYLELKWNVVLLHDNPAPEQSSRYCMHTFIVVKQSVGSAGAAGSSDFHLIWPVKEELSGRHFNTNANVQYEVHQWALRMSPGCYCKGWKFYLTIEQLHW
jgi:hypothetical protein